MAFTTGVPSPTRPRGVVVRHAMEEPDHRDSVGTVDEFLRHHGVPGIEAIDTPSPATCGNSGRCLCVWSGLRIAALRRGWMH